MSITDVASGAVGAVGGLLGGAVWRPSHVGVVALPPPRLASSASQCGPR